MKSNSKTLYKMIKKNSKSLKVKWAKRILIENTSKRNCKHIEKCLLFPVNKEMKIITMLRYLFKCWQ